MIWFVTLLYNCVEFYRLSIILRNDCFSKKMSGIYLHVNCLLSLWKAILVLWGWVSHRAWAVLREQTVMQHRAPRALGGHWDVADSMLLNSSLRLVQSSRGAAQPEVGAVPCRHSSQGKSSQKCIWHKSASPRNKERIHHMQNLSLKTMYARDTASEKNDQVWWFVVVQCGTQRAGNSTLVAHFNRCPDI